MTPNVIYAVAGIFLLSIGISGAFLCFATLKKILAVNMAGSGVFMLLIALARAADGPPHPVPQALVLTGIVVAVSATAVALALYRRLSELTDAEPPQSASQSP